MDYYKILGIKRTASPDDIKKTYRVLARKYHPDRNKGGEEKLKNITAAYEVLKDPEKRSLYDEYGLDGLRVGFDPSFFKQAKDKVSRAKEKFNEVRDKINDTGKDADIFSGSVSDIIGKLFSPEADELWERINAYHNNYNAKSHEFEVSLTFIESYNGKKIELKSGNNLMEVKVPAGIKDGEKIKVPLSDGHIIIKVAVSPHHVFKRVGNDIHMKVNVTRSQSFHGGILPVVTPIGITDITVPPRIRAGQKLKLKGAGFSRPRQEPGDLYVEIGMV